MEEDRPTLPRLADIGAQQTDRNVGDDKAGPSGRGTSTAQPGESRAEPAPRPLHPPSIPSYPTVRPDLLHQPAATAPLHRPVSSGPSFNPPLAERHIPSPPPAYVQPPSYGDRGVHSQSPAEVVASASSSTYAPYGRSQSQPGAVAEGAVTKPKKLHREVEQKRRMRMAEQIFELRKWVSNPNGGKTDKVSVLQDAVTFVKESAKKIEELQEALDRSRAECAHLRSLLSKSQPQHAVSAMPGPQSQIGHPPTHVAPISRLGGHVHHQTMGGIGGESDLSHRSHFGMTYGGYRERHIGTGTTTGTDPQGVLGQTMTPSNFGLANVPSLTGAAGGSARRTQSSQGFANPTTMGHFPPSSAHIPLEAERARQQHQGEQQLRPQEPLSVSGAVALAPGQRNLQPAYYSGSHERRQGQSSDDATPVQHPESGSYPGGTVPRSSQG